MNYTDPSVGNPTLSNLDEEEFSDKSDTHYNNNKNVDSLKKLRILLAVDVLSKSGVPATTDSIEIVTHIPRRRVVDLIRRYSCKYKLLTKIPRTDIETDLHGHFVYTLTKKGRFTLNDMIQRFNDNVTLRKRKTTHVEDHSDIVLLPGLSEAFVDALGDAEDEFQE